MPRVFASTQSERGMRAELQPTYFVCGHENPNGLRIRYVLEEDGASSALWSPASVWEGFRGIIHGGVVSTVLDEAMSKAVAATHCEALTAELRVRFRRQVVPGNTLLVRGWISVRTRRKIETEATLTAPNGTEYAHAWATFLALPRTGA